MSNRESHSFRSFGTKLTNGLRRLAPNAWIRVIEGRDPLGQAFAADRSLLIVRHSSGAMEGEKEGHEEDRARLHEIRSSALGLGADKLKANLTAFQLAQARKERVASR